MCLKFSKILFLAILLKIVNSQSIFNISLLQPSVNDLCDAQLRYIDENFNEGQVWANKILDSWGRFPSGTFSGNLYDFGHFDQCVRFVHRTNSLGIIHGQHCTIVFHHEMEGGPIRPRFAPGLFDPFVNIGVGICIPDSCSHNQIAEIANLTLMETRDTTLAAFPPLELMCSTADQEIIEWNALQIFTVYEKLFRFNLFLFSFFLSF